MPRSAAGAVACGGVTSVVEERKRANRIFVLFAPCLSLRCQRLRSRSRQQKRFRCRFGNREDHFYFDTPRLLTSSCVDTRPRDPTEGHCCSACNWETPCCWWWWWSMVSVTPALHGRYGRGHCSSMDIPTAAWHEIKSRANLHRAPQRVSTVLSEHGR